MAANSGLLRNVNEQNSITGSNKLEILLFSLGVDSYTQQRETFGINVFKVREVLRSPNITRAPDTPLTIAGMVNLRGSLIPVIDLGKYIGIKTDTKPAIMIVTEYSGQQHGFLVESVEAILRLDWSATKAPPDIIAGPLGSLVTAVTQHIDSRLVMMLDLERILSEVRQTDEHLLYKEIKPLVVRNCTVLFVDDSSIARKQIQRTLDAMEVKYISCVNGKDAWRELIKLADYADSKKISLTDILQAILTDVEMPEMDGYTLAKKIKDDSRFKGIPIIMHSSLNSLFNQELGRSVGVDGYIPKFEPLRLADTLSSFLMGA